MQGDESLSLLDSLSKETAAGYAQEIVTWLCGILQEELLNELVSVSFKWFYILNNCNASYTEHHFATHNLISQPHFVTYISHVTSSFCDSHFLSHNLILRLAFFMSQPHFATRNLISQHHYFWDSQIISSCNSIFQLAISSRNGILRLAIATSICDSQSHLAKSFCYSQYHLASTVNALLNSSLL